MRHAMIRAAAVIAATASADAPTASAHALFPGSQTIQTVGQRGIVRFQAVNGRKDVSEFVVELFELDWSPARLAIAWPERLTVRPAPPDALESNGGQGFTVMLDLKGKSERRLRVCTKSAAAARLKRVQATQLATRVCANVTVRKLIP